MSSLGELWSSAIAAALVGLLVIFRDVSFALVYCSPEKLQSSKTLMMTTLLVSSFAAQVVYSWRHSLPTAVACTSSAAVPFQSVIAASVAATLDAEPVVVLGTVMATFAVIALLYGVLLRCLGFLPHMDILKSAFPQPVMFAFFCVVGIGMLQSALELVSGQTLSMSAMAKGPPGMATLGHMALTMLAGALNRLLPKLVRHYLVLPGCLFLQILGFYLAVSFFGGVAVAREAQWLWDPFPPLALSGLPSHTDVQWPVVLSQWDKILSLLSMLVLDLLTTLLPVELMTPSKSIRMEEEFRIAGASSIAAGMLFGNVSYISLSPTRLNRDAGGHDRVSGVLSGVLCLLWILVGPQLTGYVPKFVVGGMLCHLAFGYILEGLWDPRTVLSSGEYLIIAAMISYYLVTDLAPAIFLGLALCSFTFILRYSQSSTLDFVKVAGDASMVSNRFRPAGDLRYLKSSRSIVVARSFCSQLFFGTMASILAEVDPFLSGETRFLLLDLSSLRSIDSSGLIGFQKIPAQIQVVMVCLREELETQVRAAQLSVAIFGSIDEGLEWCEDRVLKFRYLDSSDLESLLLVPNSNNPSLPSRDMPRLTSDQLRQVLRNLGEGLEELAPLVLQLAVKKHEIVFHEGSVAEGLYVVVFGTLQIQHGNQRGIVLGPGEVVADVNVQRAFGGEGSAARGRAVCGGELLCEAALYTPQLHSWSLVANVPSMLLLLRRDQLLLAEQRHSQAAIALHRCLMASQLQKSGQWATGSTTRRTASM